MSLTPSCANCHFWLYNDAHNNRYAEGPCRRFPPQSMEYRGDTKTRWPQTKGYEWCGEFQQKKEKAT